MGKNHGHKLQEWLYHDRCARKLKLRYLSLVPKPSLVPVFDCLQYIKTEPEGLGESYQCYHVIHGMGVTFRHSLYTWLCYEED